MKRKITKQERNQIIQFIKNGEDNSALNIILSKGNTSYEEGMEFLNRLKNLYITLSKNEANFENAIKGKIPEENPEQGIPKSSEYSRLNITITILIFIITSVIITITIFIV